MKKMVLRRSEVPVALRHGIQCFEQEQLSDTGRFEVEEIELRGRWIPHEPMRHPDDDATGFVGDPNPAITGALK
jgi:hypothetical protein